jgi:hypothetical protein
MTTRKDVDVTPETADGRAQPGDVLGIEQDGERTHLGDTREDEDERRDDAEEAVDDRIERRQDR